MVYEWYMFSFSAIKEVINNIQFSFCEISKIQNKNLNLIFIFSLCDKVTIAF